MTSFHGLAHRANVGAGDWVAIHGCGGVGLSAGHIADALGANVIAVDLVEERLSKAEGLGAVETVDASDFELFPGARGAEDLRARSGGQLDGCRSHAAGRRVDQYPVALL